MVHRGALAASGIEDLLHALRAAGHKVAAVAAQQQRRVALSGRHMLRAAADISQLPTSVDVLHAHPMGSSPILLVPP